MVLVEPQGLQGDKQHCPQMRTFIETPKKALASWGGGGVYTEASRQSPSSSLADLMPAATVQPAAPTIHSIKYCATKNSPGMSGEPTALATASHRCCTSQAAL
jgi:hypothetical protein